MSLLVAAPFSTFFAALNAAGIAWCHWKSNQHLEAAVAGDTDADLLFDPDRKKDVLEALQKSGFVLFKPAPHRAYDNVVDALTLDGNSGRLLHAHCHFALTLGEKHLKSYRLPMEHTVLARRVDTGHGIYTSDPVDEYILLCVREALKMRLRDVFTVKPWGGASVLPEMAWLKARITKPAITARAAEWFDGTIASHIVTIFDEGTTGTAMIALAHDLRDYAAEEGWRAVSPVHAYVLRVWREGMWVLSRIQSRFNLDCPFIARRRTLPGTGRLIAFLGVDGSGKSTVTRSLLKTLNKKIDVRLVYYGTGDGPKTMVQKLGLLVKKAGRTKKTSTGVKKGTGWKNILWALLAAHQKKKTREKVEYLRARGVIVLCDRYPQTQQSGMNDGPRLVHLLDHSNPLKRAAARLEAAQFALFDTAPPDAVVCLMPSLDVALARKPGDVAPDMLQQKMDGLKALHFSPVTQKIDIDANQKLEDVLSQSLNAVWARVAA